METEPDLNARIRRLEDRAELIELTYRYAIAVDDRDFDTIGELFSENAIFEVSGGTHTGREAVVNFYRNRLPQFGATVHTPNGHVLELLDDDHARGEILSHAEIAIDGETYWLAFRYSDRYVREKGVWRFELRDVRMVYVMPLSELPKGLGIVERKRWPNTTPAAADLPEPLDTYVRSLQPRED